MQFPIQDKHIHMSKKKKQQKTAVRQNMNESRAMSKNVISDHKAKTQSECNKTLDVMKCLKFSIMKRFFKTTFILRSKYFLWLQLQFRMKSWNYVLEFKC